MTLNTTLKTSTHKGDFVQPQKLTLSYKSANIEAQLLESNFKVQFDETKILKLNLTLSIKYRDEK